MILFQRLFKSILSLKTSFIGLSSVLLIVVSVLVMRWIEPNTFPTYFDSFWWVMTTVTTVGYGDFYPISVPGRLYAVFLYLFGIGLIGIVIGKLVDGFAKFRAKKEEGKMSYKGNHHVVIVGWSKRAEYTLDEIIKADHNLEVVLINTLEKTPISH
ncbi:potassium channel family protein [Bacillus sp. 31A1R]|uniref:Potassium channel family protein n=1 Tax=Robertmurraya mangrovi TaxID=3098077 RepID=A0ABU5IZN1_9BACI|nr:potassium channel family protein [Bacillus sp. 31A1R]MDZ5472577.1 potassium channel family protein [Bacillus sp. 31A1R]